MFDLFQSDVARLHRHGSGRSTLRLLVDNQGLWACICYRAGNGLNRHRLPSILCHVALVFYHIWWKLVQITMWIWIRPDWRIGPGLYISHFGQIIVHPDCVIGEKCILSQVVTLGLDRKGDRWGPTLGDRVYIEPSAKVVGPIHLASGTVVGANAVVTKDTEENAVVFGVPARVISHDGSSEYIR